MNDDFEAPSLERVRQAGGHCALLVEPGSEVGRVLALARRQGLKATAGQSTGPALIRVSGDSKAVHRTLKMLASQQPSTGGTKAATSSPRVVAAVPRRLGVMRSRPKLAAVSSGEGGLFTAPMLARGYGFPEGACTDQRIAIILLAGGISDEWVAEGGATYFQHVGLRPPKITVTEIWEARNDPAPIADVEELILALGGGERGAPAPGQGTATPIRKHGQAVSKAGRRKTDGQKLLEDPVRAERAQWTAEGIMEIELIGSLAVGAEIRVYIAQNAAADISQALIRAVDDGATVISCSWGNAENQLEKDEIPLVEAALAHAKSRNVTVCFSTGDHGAAADTKAPKRLTVSYPGSSPQVLAVGGTKLSLTARGGAIGWSGERVWKESIVNVSCASAGGFSELLPVPAWQRPVLVRRRGVRGRACPDVAAAAALSSGCWIWFGGKTTGVNSAAAGTSAAVPTWASLIACLNQALGSSLGLVTPRLYALAGTRSFRDITTGDSKLNGLSQHRAREGWDACTGLGTPHGEALLQALRGGPHKPVYSAPRRMMAPRASASVTAGAKATAPRAPRLGRRPAAAGSPPPYAPPGRSRGGGRRRAPGR
jgi:hypothetical protein